VKDRATRPRPAAKRVAGADDSRWPRLRPARRSQAGRQLRALCRSAGRLIAEFGLIEEGDRVVCALSGGRDSATLLEVLLRLRAKAPVRFTVAAIVVQPGFPEFDAAAVADFAAARGVETFRVDADILGTMQDLGWKATPCAMCSRLRRGVLYRVSAELGFNRLALGHHGDDAIETALMNMLFNGQLRAMAPRLVPEPPAPLVIRPLLGSFESEVAAYARARGFQTVDAACPLCDLSMDSERKAIKHLLLELSADHPRIRSSLLASLGNVSPESLLDQRLTRSICIPSLTATSKTRSSR
jgi:tRNA 2-thiocytidine biosynthesis protein TtcA